jgi:hypothetical protein
MSSLLLTRCFASRCTPTADFFQSSQLGRDAVHSRVNSSRATLTSICAADSRISGFDHRRRTGFLDSIYRQPFDSVPSGPRHTQTVISRHSLVTSRRWWCISIAYRFPWPLLRWWPRYQTSIGCRHGCHRSAVESCMKSVECTVYTPLPTDLCRLMLQLADVEGHRASFPSARSGPTALDWYHVDVCRRVKEWTDEANADEGPDEVRLPFWVGDRRFACPHLAGVFVEKGKKRRMRNSRASRLWPVSCSVRTRLSNGR